MNTNWTKATQDPFIALTGLLSCMAANRNCWIEHQENGDQDFPITIPNPALDDPFNWTMSYGIPGQPDPDHKYLNETERDLTFNWTAQFGEEKAVERYRKTGKLTKAALKNAGVCFPCRKKDFLAIRRDLKGWTEEQLWTTYWQPRDGVPYHVDAPIGKVFVVCYDDKPVCREKLLLKASEFLVAVAKSL